MSFRWSTTEKALIGCLDFGQIFLVATLPVDYYAYVVVRLTLYGLGTNPIRSGRGFGECLAITRWRIHENQDLSGDRTALSDAWLC